MVHGTVISWDADAGEGSLRAEPDGDVVPFETENLAENVHPSAIAEGVRVEFEVVGGLAGVSAQDVRPE